MSKPLAGKRRFEAWGRSTAARGVSVLAYRSQRARWPLWAREAWARGWLDQHWSNR